MGVHIVTKPHMQHIIIGLKHVCLDTHGEAKFNFWGYFAFARNNW